MRASIYDVNLKALLEPLSSRLVPERETFVNFNTFDTFVDPFWFQNVEEVRDPTKPDRAIATSELISLKLSFLTSFA